MPKKKTKTQSKAKKEVNFKKKALNEQGVAVLEKPVEEIDVTDKAEDNGQTENGDQSETNSQVELHEEVNDTDDKFEWKIHHIEKELGNYTDELNEKILEYLEKLELITNDQAIKIKDIHRVEGVNIASIILNEKIMKEDEIGNVMANYFHCNYLILRDTKIDAESLRHLPEMVAYNEMALVYNEDENMVYLVMVNPSDQHFIHLVEKKTGKKVKTYYSTPRQIKASLKNYQRSLKENIDHLIAQADQNIERLDSLDNISTIFDTLILLAYNRGASDIHIEPFEDSIRIRFRIDGIMGTATTLPMHFLDTMVNHVKVLAKLRTDEHSSDQDGRFNITYDQTHINLRVSILLTHNGEKTVMRLLPV